MKIMPTCSLLALLMALPLVSGMPGQQAAVGRPKARPVATPPTPMPDSVLVFDGVDDRVTVPYDPSFPTEVFTIAAWIKLPVPAQGRAAIIARGEDDNSFNLSWQLYVNGNLSANPGTLELMLEDSNEHNYCYPLNNCFPGGNCAAGNLFVADDNLHHVAATRTATGVVSIYIDAQLRGLCTNTGVPSSNNFHDLSIGCTYGSIGIPSGPEPPIWFLSGQVDDAAMWNVALDAAAIQEIFTLGVDPDDPALRGYWNFDEAQGQDVEDLSGAGNHGFRGVSPARDSADPDWLTP